MAAKALSDLDDSQKTSQLEVNAMNFLLMLFIAENLVNILLVGARSHFKNNVCTAWRLKENPIFSSKLRVFLFNTIPAMDIYIYGG